MIKAILDELNLENGSNYKIKVLMDCIDNELLQRVLKMTYDKVSFTYGVTMKNIKYTPEAHRDLSDFDYTLEMALDNLQEKFCTRSVTGNEAKEVLINMLEELSKDDAYVLEKILERDLKINLGRTNINKAYKGLIVKPPYMRCDIGTKANVTKNIDFSKKVYSNVKMDGTYRSSILDTDITIMSRPGIEDTFPIIEANLIALNVNGYVMIGEMTLRGEKDRKKGNGLINSSNPPHEDIVYTLWDMIPLHEYRMSKDELKEHTAKGNATLYEERFEMLEELLINNPQSNVELIEYRIVKSMREAFEHFQEVTQDGGEGTVIKAHDMPYKDGTSKKQLKVKLEIYLDLRCTGLNYGGKGKRADTFKSMKLSNDEGTIVGQCSGFSDDELKEISENPEKFIGRVFEAKCNDITKARDKDTYALSHGNFQMWRDDKDTTDTLARAMELKEMAMELK